jgi:hypothetical protein
MPGTTDRRAVWPFEDVDLGPDLTADVPPGTAPEDWPRRRARLFYRNRDLAAIEDAYGSLDAMQQATADNPTRVLPHVLWLGLRHDLEWSDEDAVDELHGSATWSVDTQVAVARALAKALGGSADDAEAETRRAMEQGGKGVKLEQVGDDDGEGEVEEGETEDPPHAAAG